MDTHIGSQDQDSIRDEIFFEQCLDRCRRNHLGCTDGNWNNNDHPYLRPHLQSIIRYLECNKVRALFDDLIQYKVQYEEIFVSTCYDFDKRINEVNYQEDLITTWYQWIGLIYRDHPFVYRTLTNLNLLDNDLFIEDFSLENKKIEFHDIASVIHTAETGLKLIAVYSVFGNTKDQDTLRCLNSITDRLQIPTDSTVDKLPDTFLRRHQYFTPSIFKCDTKEALSELNFAAYVIANYRRDL